MSLLNHLGLLPVDDRCLSGALMPTMTGIMWLLIIFYSCPQDLVDFDLGDLSLRVQRSSLTYFREDIPAYSCVNLSIDMVKLIATEVIIGGEETIEYIRQIRHVFFSGKRFYLELLSISLSLDLSNIDVALRHNVLNIAL
jgi:hypothetical protein